MFIFRSQQSNFDNIAEWWGAAARTIPKDQKCTFNGVVIYTWWNVWNERNRRIFNN
jgi:hypothetical protein